MKQGHINDWAPEVTALLNRLVAAGAKLISGDNGEDKFKFDGDLPKFVENLIACDEAHVFVNTPHCPAGRNRWIYIVLGNLPGEIASDYIIDPLFDKVISEHYDEWEGKEQPTKPSPYPTREQVIAEERAWQPPQTVRVDCPALKLSGNMVVLDVVNGEVPGPDPVKFDSEKGAA